MQVVVNSIFIWSRYREDYVNFLQNTFGTLAKNYPEHSFVFLCEKSGTNLFVTEKNTIAHFIKSPADNALLWKYWYDVKIPGILRKYKADIFITVNGFCSLATQVPQCMIIEDLAINHFPAYFSRLQRLFFKRYHPLFMNKAKQIVTLSSFSKTDIIKKYQLPAAKIDVVDMGVNEIFGPVEDDKKEEIKEHYTDSRDFFLYLGQLQPSNNLVHLLKAFSLFKKRQQSNLKLVLCTINTDEHVVFLKTLKSYKYRNDIVYLENAGAITIATLVASAYAVVYPVLFDAFSSPLLNAMKCKVPVVMSNNSPQRELIGDAALSADPTDYKGLAEQLMLIYKDENKRNELIKKGFSISLQFNWAQTANQMWSAILKTV